MIGEAKRGVSLRDPPDDDQRGVPPEVLELALRRRIRRIEELLEELRRGGTNVDDLLEELYRREGHVAGLWRQVNSDILERSGRGQVSLREALEWIDLLDRWFEAVRKGVRDLAGKGNGSP